MAGADPAEGTLVEAMQALAPGGQPEEPPDWAGGVPVEVLAKVAGKLVAQNEAAWAAHLREKDPKYWTEERMQHKMMANRKHGGNCLFVFALVCRGWRKAQLKVGGPLRTRVMSDVLMPGSVALAKWALAEGCPREGDGYYTTMAHYAAEYGHLELVQSLCGEEGASWGFARFAMDEHVMMHAARSGNLELVKWLRANGCPWDANACHVAVRRGHVRVLRWARENGCKWTAATRDRAAGKLGYTDDLGNAVDNLGNAVQ